MLPRLRRKHVGVQVAADALAVADDLPALVVTPERVREAANRALAAYGSHERVRAVLSTRLADRPTETSKRLAWARDVARCLK